MQLGPVTTNKSSSCWLLWQVTFTKQRATHGLFFEHGNLPDKLGAINRRVNSPLADPEVQGALGWVLRLDTQGPGLPLTRPEPKGHVHARRSLPVQPPGDPTFPEDPKYRQRTNMASRRTRFLTARASRGLAGVYVCGGRG